MNSTINAEAIKLIVDLLIERLDPYFIQLFGSGARGELRDESDLDLAVLTVREIDGYSLFLVGQELAGMLGREVDLIDLRKASTVMRAQIAGKSRLIYEKEPLHRQLFQMTALKDYALLNEERQPVIDRFKGVSMEEP